MKNMLTILLTLISLTCFGQLVIYSTQDTTDRFAIDTLRVSGDSSFVTISHINKGILIHKEDQIRIRFKGISTNCNGDMGADLYIIKTIFHGTSLQWYLNGLLKCKGTFTFDKKNSDWKYWNENGVEIPEPPNNEALHIGRGSQTCYIDGGKVPADKKRRKRRRNEKKNGS